MRISLPCVRKVKMIALQHFFSLGNCWKLISGSKFQPSALDFKTPFFGISLPLPLPFNVLTLHVIKLVYRCRHWEFVITVPLPLPFLFLIFQEYKRNGFRPQWSFQALSRNFSELFQAKAFLQGISHCDFCAMMMVTRVLGEIHLQWHDVILIS